MNSFRHLFSPIAIGPIVAPNRIMMAAHTTLFAENGIMSDRYVDYVEERAKGGVGVVVAEMQLVLPNAVDYIGADYGHDERVVPMYRKLAEAVHRHGTKVFAQVNHTGRQTDSGISRLPIWAPSAIACPFTREMPKEMAVEDIQEVVRAFGQVVAYAREGGLDGVEIHGMTGYLVQQFLSPFSNRRQDEYGGSVENRMRLLLEVLREIRSRVGSDFVVGVRMPVDEFVPGGLTLDDACEIAVRLEGTGQVDYLSLSAGNYASIMTTLPKGMGSRLGMFAPMSAAIREVVKIPVAVAGRIIDPLQAEQILSDGQADLVAMARELISEPEFGVKAKEGRLDELRTCLGCNQGCHGRLFMSRPISCLQNPAVGYEREVRVGLQPVANPKRVLVVGGGPAGMETARVAAQRGHRVSLYEKSDKLGGKVNLASIPPGREEFSGITRYLSTQMEKLGVDVHLNRAVDFDLVRSLDPDVVVVATGAVPAKPEIPGSESARVISVEEAMQGGVDAGKHVVLLDEDNHRQGTGAATFLAERGCKVELITRLITVAQDITAMDIAHVYQQLLTLGVVLSPRTVVKGILGRTVVVTDVFTGAERTIENVDVFVVAGINRADDGLYRLLKGKVKELLAVGDCVAPRKAIDAIFDGNRLGRLI